MKRSAWDLRLLEWMQRSPTRERASASRPLLAFGGALWGVGVGAALSGAWTRASALGALAVIVWIAARLR